MVFSALGMGQGFQIPENLLQAVPVLAFQTQKDFSPVEQQVFPQRNENQREQRHALCSVKGHFWVLHRVSGLTMQGCARVKAVGTEVPSLINSLISPLYTDTLHRSCS